MPPLLPGVSVGCVSLEMRTSQLVRPLAMLNSGLHPGRFWDARDMTVTEYDHAKASIRALAELPIVINDQSGLNASQISSQARQMHEAGATIIFVDFVQIIRQDEKDRREAINRASASLRDTYKLLNIPVVVASQPARRDADPNRRPNLQDLRESRKLEHYAHNVLMLYRPVDQQGEWTGLDRVIIAKQREGVTGDIDVRYDTEALIFGLGEEQWAKPSRNFDRAPPRGGPGFAATSWRAAGV